MSTQNQYDVTVSVDDPNGTLGQLGTFDTMTGGEVDSEDLKYRPGGMAATVSLGGTKTVGNVVVGRLYRLNRDHPIIHRMTQLVGRANVTVSKQPLDADGNAYGQPLVYTGKLKTVTPPEVDSNADDAAVWTMEISSAGTVG
jgi:hypothetical protein